MEGEAEKDQAISRRVTIRSRRILFVQKMSLILWWPEGLQLQPPSTARLMLYRLILYFPGRYKSYRCGQRPEVPKAETHWRRLFTDVLDTLESTN